jgi:hypothetical protein
MSGQVVRFADGCGDDVTRSIVYSSSIRPATLLCFLLGLSSMKTFLLVLGTISGLLILAQLVMGQLIVSGQAEWIKRHQHSGYLTVAVALVYIVLSLMRIASMPGKNKV